MKAKELLNKIETHNEIEKLVNGGNTLIVHLDVNGHTLTDEEGDFEFTNYKSFKKAVSWCYTSSLADLILNIDIEVNERMGIWVTDELGNRKRIPLTFYVWRSYHK